MFDYQNEEACYYYGLVVDSDVLFIGVAVDNKFQVEKLNMSGERQEVYSIFGNSHPLRLVEDELGVFRYDNKRISFYGLLK